MCLVSGMALNLTVSMVYCSDDCVSVYGSVYDCYFGWLYVH